MALSIESERAGRLVRELADLTGESITDVGGVGVHGPVTGGRVGPTLGEGRAPPAWAAHSRRCAR